MWREGGKQAEPRWRWQASDPHRGTVVADVWGRRQNEGVLPWQALLAPVHIPRSSTDGWGAYTRHLDPAQHAMGKAHTQKIASKPIHGRPRIKRLVRHTICFAQTTTMHDLVVGLFINRYAFGGAI